MTGLPPRTVNYFAYSSVSIDSGIHASVVILQTSMKTEMVKLKNLLVSKHPSVSLASPLHRGGPSRLEKFCSLKRLFPELISQVREVPFRTNMMLLIMIIDPYGFNRSVG